ncbi:MAG: hypothetical protein R8M45_04325 [Ghiorsea sp.]
MTPTMTPCDPIGNCTKKHQCYRYTNRAKLLLQNQTDTEIDPSIFIEGEFADCEYQIAIPVEKKMMRQIKNATFTIFHREYWVMLNKYDAGWDDFIRKSLENPTFESTASPNGCTVVLNGVTLWLANFPYASMTSEIFDKTVRPSRLTIHEVGVAYQKWRKWRKVAFI